MAGSSGYVYLVRLPSTAFTASKTLLQIKTGNAPIDILDIHLYQLTLKATELWELLFNRYLATGLTPATVTSQTPMRFNTNDPASLAVGGTTATGYNATAEPSTTGTVDTCGDGWNILNGVYQMTDIPEGRLRIPQGGAAFTLKLNTAPSASANVGGWVRFIEYQ